MNDKLQSASALPQGVLEGAKFIFETAGIKDNQLTLALDKVYKSYTGKSALLEGDIHLEASDGIDIDDVAQTIIPQLNDVIQSLQSLPHSDDYEDNVTRLIDWIYKFEAVSHFAHKIVESYISPLGYHVIETTENE